MLFSPVVTNDPAGHKNDTPGPASIPAASKRQAMDWSLVLLSQGIESHIMRLDDVPGWALLVPAELREKSVGIIDQYCAENRGWTLRHPVFRTGFHLDWSAVVWVLLILF